jgi:RND family efflux transporter MFP subunit
VNSQDAKSELLQQLKIDKSQPTVTGFSALAVIVCCALSAVVGATVVYFSVLPAPSPEEPKTQITSRPAANPNSSEANNFPDKEAGGLNNDRGEEILNASGYITARRITTVSSETMGLLDSVDVEEGMTVTSGQVLARLDNTIASVNHNLALAQVEVLSARLTSIESDLTEAKRILTRTQQLDESKFSSEAQLTRAQTDVDKLMSAKVSAEADIKVAQLEVKRQRELLEKHTIRAPFTGVVTKKNAQPGEIVSPSSAGGGFTRTGICTIVDMDSLEIEVDVNEAFIGRVYAEQAVVATLDAYPNWDIAAKVIAIIPTADRAKATVRVRIGIIDKDARILPDMGVKVAFLK